MANPNANVPGVNGITGFVIADPEAPPEVVHGGPVNPAHARWGEQAQPYSWESQLSLYDGFTGPQGPENLLLGELPEYMTMGAGILSEDPQADMFPASAGQLGSSHAAPTTRTLSGALPSQYDAINQQLPQSAAIHAADYGASRAMSFNTEGQDVLIDPSWQLVDIDVPGTDNVPESPQAVGMSSGGFGTNDHRSNKDAKVNNYGFGAAHFHRRLAAGTLGGASIPGNYMWMKPGGRPLVKSQPGPARPAVGENSPFAGQDVGATFGIQGAVLVNTPSEYTAPPQPLLAPAADTSATDDPPVISYWM